MSGPAAQDDQLTHTVDKPAASDKTQSSLNDSE